MRKWPITPLAEIASIQMGQSPPGETYNTLGNGLPFFQGKAEFGKDYPTRVKWCSQPNRIAEKGDILLSVRAPVGPTNIAIEKCCIGRGLAAIRTNPKVCNQRYLRYYFRRFEDEIAARGVGSTFFAINRTDIERLELSVPPLLDQERIVKLLDEADELRKLRGQADKKSAELIPALFEEMFGDPIINQNKWKATTLADACIKIADGTHFSPPPAKSGVPYITAKHLRDYGLDFERDPTFVSEEDHREIYRRCDPKRGDVLYIKDGVTTGIAAINYYDFEFSMLSSLALLRPNPEKCNSEYLCEWLNNKRVKSTMLDQMAGAAIRRLTLVKINKASILLPPINIQQAFASRVSEIRALESSQSSSRKNLDALFQSMLHRAFQGEL
jgi:type I restriction enzyme S subunit